ncbi:hypothetical protein T484DRAFT_1758557, partial [Baffinella frigidus]
MFTCLVDGCNKSYRHPGELKQHDEYEHKKIYRNVCDHIDKKGAKCGKKFKRPSDLERHTLAHSDDCDVKCTDCTAAFKTKHKYGEHWVRRHSPPNHPARTKHKCEECPEGFVTSTDLNRHCLHNHVPKDDPRLAARRK